MEVRLSCLYSNVYYCIAGWKTLTNVTVCLNHRTLNLYDTHAYFVFINFIFTLIETNDHYNHIYDSNYMLNFSKRHNTSLNKFSV